MLNNKQRTGRLQNLTVVAIAAMTMVWGTAPANAEGFYIGAGIGQSKLKDPATALIVDSGVEDTDTAWKAFAGYQFPRTPFSVEFGYVDFGEFTASAPGFSDSWKATAMTLEGVAGLPINKTFSIFAKLGAARWDVDDQFTALGIDNSPQESGTDMTFGVGAQFDFSKMFSVRIEWERFKDVGVEDTTGKSDLDLLSINAVLRFK